jgi:transcriptional regulator with XRE-family HTH domain
MSRAGAGASAKPHPIDTAVGRQIRRRRIGLGLSQGSLASALGVTFQQVQKYERGSNRVSASRLYQLAQVLNTPVSYFFVELISVPMDGNQLTDTDGGGPGLIPSRDMLEVMQDYAAIRDRQLRKAIRELLHLMARNF